MKVSIGNYPKKGKRRISVKIDKWDTWNMDHTLALIVHPMLKQLLKTQHGAPNTDDEDVPEHLRSTAAKPKENEWDTDEFHFKRWDWILREMIWAFGEIAKSRDPDFWIVKPLFKWTKGENGRLEVKREGVRDEAKYAAYHERKRNGLRLFGKYFGSLWD